MYLWFKIITSFIVATVSLLGFFLCIEHRHAGHILESTWALLSFFGWLFIAVDSYLDNTRLRYNAKKKAARKTTIKD
jgi:uncharacterized membrane protein